MAKVKTIEIPNGMRAQVCFPVIDNPIPGARDAAEAIAKGLKLRDDTRHSGLITTAFGPHAPYTVGDETLPRIRPLADELDMPIHMHVHETAGEVADAVTQTGERPLQRLQRLGLLGPRLQAVHMTDISDADLALLVEYGVQLVHCPESNLKLASGMMPVQRLLDSGLNVALGTDGAASNNDLDMFGEMRTAAMLAKIVAGAPTALDAHSALHMATLAGARALGLDEEIGSLEVGKQAALLLLDLAQPNLTPTEINAAGGNLLWNLVFAADARNVAAVWVDGRQLIDNGRATRVSEQTVISEAQQQGLALFQQCRDIAHLRTSMI